MTRVTMTFAFSTDPLLAHFSNTTFTYLVKSNFSVFFPERSSFIKFHLSVLPNKQHASSPTTVEQLTQLLFIPGRLHYKHLLLEFRTGTNNVDSHTDSNKNECRCMLHISTKAEWAGRSKNWQTSLKLWLV